MTQNFKALVLTYKTAPVEVREQVSLNEEGSKKLLAFIRDYATTNDVLVVSDRDGKQHGGAREILIPFIADAIKQVDIAAGLIAVDWGRDY